MLTATRNGFIVAYYFLPLEGVGLGLGAGLAAASVALGEGEANGGGVTNTVTVGIGVGWIGTRGADVGALTTTATTP